MNQEEKIQELADKKVAKTYLQEFEEKIATKIEAFNQNLDATKKGFLIELKDFKPSFDVNHKLSELKEVNTLEIRMDRLVEAIKGIDIPKVVKVENRVSFKDRTRKFLIWYFVSSLIIIGGLCYLAFSNLYPLYNSMNKEKEASYFEGAKFGVKHALNTLDKGNFKTARKYIVKNTNSEYLN